MMRGLAWRAQRHDHASPVERRHRAARRRRSARARRARAATVLGRIVRDYIALTKPRIISLLLLTTVATMFVADPVGPPLSTDPLDDARRLPGRRRRRGDQPLPRPRARRPHGAHPRRARSSPGGSSPRTGSSSGSCSASLATVQLAITVNVLAAALALAGLLGYVFVYTLWLKPLTPQNIVIGGAAGAVPPLVGWAAATGGLTLDAL